MTKKNKASFFENVNQIDKLLPGLRERGKEVPQPQINNIKNGKGEMIIVDIEIKNGRVYC